jgi:hypothetical protein
MLAKIALSIFLVLTAGAGLAQPQSPYDNLREQRAYEREQRHGDYQGEHRPRWCQGYSWRDHRRAMRRCGDDLQCRMQVRRRAIRCGLRG